MPLSLVTVNRQTQPSVDGGPEMSVQDQRTVEMANL